MNAIILLADSAANAPSDWRAWLTPEMIVSVLSTVAAILGWLGRSKYQRIATSIIAGVEAYRRDDATPKAQAGDVATAIRLRAEADGVEALLKPLVKAITGASGPPPAVGGGA